MLYGPYTRQNRPSVLYNDAGLLVSYRVAAGQKLTNEKLTQLRHTRNLSCREADIDAII